MPIVKIEQYDGDADACARLLTFAKDKLRDWNNFGAKDDARSQTFSLPDGIVRIRQTGEFQFIAISGGGGTYTEFQTSGLPVTSYTLPNSQFSVTAYNVAVIGVTFDGLKASSTIRKGTREPSAQISSLIKRPNQSGLVNELGRSVTSGKLRTNDPTVKHFPRVLYQSSAPLHPYTGVYRTAVNLEGTGTGFYAQRGSYDGQYNRDVGFDVPWGDNTGTKPVRLSLLNNNIADWPRASGLQTVTDITWGKREFAIYVDAFDQFFAFPTSKITPFNPPGAVQNQGAPPQNIDPKYVQQASIAWPTDSRFFRKYERSLDYVAATGDIGSGALVNNLFPEYQWMLHPDGTKACAVMFYRQPADFDTSYFTGGGDTTPTQYASLTNKSSGILRRHNATDSDVWSEFYFIGNALVELTLTITLTGQNPQDFTFSIAVNVVRHPEVTPYCTYLAGYTWYDIPDGNGGYIANRGDLCTLDIERYYRTDIQANDPSNPTVLCSFFSLKNLTQAGTELSSWWGGNTGAVNIQSQVIDFDMGSLSFVFNTVYTESITRTYSSAPTSVTWFVAHPSATVVTFGRLQRTLFPDAAPVYVQTAVAIAVSQSGRAQLAALPGTWQFLSYNDTSEWIGSTSDPASTNNIRNYASNLDGTHVNASFVTPSAAKFNWWYYATSAYYPGSNPIHHYAAHPRFSWHAYADEIIARNAKTKNSTFYVHPNGSWWFWDQHHVYNTYGVPSAPIYVGRDFVSEFKANATLEHVIFDAVHLQNSNGSLDTSFIDLYNLAIDNGNKSASLTDNFQKITKAGIRAQFTLQSVGLAGGLTGLQVQTNWAGQTWYYIEPGICGTTGANANTGGLVDLTLGDFFSTGPGYTGTYWPPSAPNTTTPATFSSPVIIT